MKYQKKKFAKRSAALCLSAMLLAQPLSVSAAVFADIGQVPWSGAEVPIYQANALGLMVGEVRNGQSYFRPQDSVSLCEAAQLAYKLLLNTGKTSASSLYTLKWRTTLDQYQIPNWVRPAVAFCLENNILTTSELSGFMKNGSPAAATREQTAKILGRALIYGVPAYQLGTGLSSFTDSSLISADARAYVVLLEQEGVVNGDNLGKFNPKRTINRTETAVLVTNLYPMLLMQSSVVPSSGKSGQISALTNTYLSFKDAAEYYYFASSVSVSINGSVSSLANLIVLYHSGTPLQATVTLDSTKHISAISVDSSIPKETEGALTNVTRNVDGSGTLTLDSSRVFPIEDVEDFTLRIDNKSKKYDALMKLHDDEEELFASLTLDSAGYVTRASVSTDGDYDEDDDDDDDDRNGDGTIDSMKTKSSDRGEITVDGDKYTVDDIDDVDIDVEDGEDTIDNWEDLLDAVEEQDKVIEVTLKTNSDDEVTKITGEVVEAKGRLVDYSSNSLKLKIDGTTYTYKFTASDADEIDVDIDGIKSSVNNLEKFIDYLDDLDDDDDLNLTGSDKFTLTLTLKNSKIDEIEGEYDD